MRNKGTIIFIPCNRNRLFPAKCNIYDKVPRVYT